MDTFIFLSFCYLFGILDMRVIYMISAKEIIFTCVIYDTTVYHQSECDITGFAWLESCCDLVRGITTWFQVLGQIVMNILPVWGRSYIGLLWTSLCKLYLSMNYCGNKWTTIQTYLYLCIYVLRLNPFIIMHIYLIPGYNTIMFQWSFIFERSTIKVLIFTG